jgi:hypothetical protein
MVCWNRSTFPAGSGVVRSAVLLGDAEAAQFVFEAGAAFDRASAAGEAGGVDHAVVCEC